MTTIEEVDESSSTNRSEMITPPKMYEGEPTEEMILVDKEPEDVKPEVNGPPILHQTDHVLSYERFFPG